MGDTVRVKGSSKCGVVLEIQRDPALMEWRGMSPRFIKIEYQGQIRFVSPSDLKVIKK